MCIYYIKCLWANLAQKIQLAKSFKVFKLHGKQADSIAIVSAGLYFVDRIMNVLWHFTCVWYDMQVQLGFCLRLYRFGGDYKVKLSQSSQRL